MIPAPNAYFETEEARRRGARPRLLFTFIPHNFLTGIAAGSGTFVGCAYVAPGRIEVNPSAGTASWTSPDIDATLWAYPANATFSWAENMAGYTLAAEYKTAATQAGLAGAAWQTLTNGLEYALFQWYELRFSFSGLRCLAVETAGGGARNALAVESLPDDSTSYAAESQGGDTYVEGVGIEGEYPIAPRDVSSDSPSLPRLEAPIDFSDLVTGEMTFTLKDPDSRFNPNSPDFIFHGEEFWFSKDLGASFGYQRRGQRLYDTIPFFEGRILRMGPRETQGGKAQMPQVEVYSQDLISLLFKQPIAPPLADGSLQPAVYGNDLMVEATELVNQNPTAPYVYADFETGDLSQIAGTETGAGGSVAVSTTAPYRGAYCCRTTITAAANSKAIGKAELAAPGTMIQAKARMRVNSMPAVPEAQSARIFGLYEIDGTLICEIYVDSDTRLWVKHDAAWWSTDCLLGAYQGTVDVGIAFLGANPGLLVIWLDGNEIFRKDDHSFADRTAYGFWFGAKTGSVAESWDLSWDDVQVWNTYYPVTYQVPGYPYQEIKGVYVEGISTFQTIRKRTRRQKKLDRKMRKAIKRGRKAVSTNYTAYPELGFISWTDWQAAPGGEIRFNLSKDDNTHPVDILEAMLTSWGWGGKIDSASFAAAKAATPDDEINCYFEDGTRAEAVKEICALCLLGFYQEQGKVCLWPYTGAALGTPAMAINLINRRSSRSTFDLTELVSKVRGVWGMSDQNKDLKYEVVNEQLLEILGDDDEELDFSYGQPVNTNNAEMVKAKVNALALRLQNVRETCELETYLETARLQLYDVVEVAGFKYQVVGKELDVAARSVNLNLVRFMGLEA